MIRFFMFMFFLLILACTAKMGKDAVVAIDGKVFSREEFFADMVESRFKALDIPGRRKVVKEFANRQIVAMEIKRLRLLESEELDRAKTRARENLIVDKIIEEEVWTGVLTDSSLTVLYDRLGWEIGVHHIVLTFKGSLHSKSDRSEKDALNLIREIRERVIQGELKFYEAAKLYSEDPSKFNDGQLGRVKWGELFEPVQSLAFSMDSGEISEPVRSDVGYHIVRVSGIKKIPFPPYEEMIPELKKFIRSGRGREFQSEMRKFEARLQRRYAVSFNPDIISQLFSEIKQLHGDQEGAPRSFEITQVDLPGIVCVAGGVPVELSWFRENITLLGSPFTESLILSEWGLEITLEHVLYRFLARHFAEETRDEAWYQDIEEQVKRKSPEILLRVLLDFWSEDDRDISKEELIQSLLDRYEIDINENFLSSYEESQTPL